MAEHAHSTPAPTASRRRFVAGLLTISTDSVIASGVAAGTAANVGDLASFEVGPDAALLPPRAELLAAVADVSWPNMVDDVSYEKLNKIGGRPLDVCLRLVKPSSRLMLNCSTHHADIYLVIFRVSLSSY